MNTEEVQGRVNALAAAMLDKGLREPMAWAEFHANREPAVVIGFHKPGVTDKYAAKDFHTYRADAVEQVFEKADAFIATMPSAEETRRADFLAKLAATIELGKQHGIEVELVNPLIETMKRLSENIITHQPDKDAQ